MLDCFCLKDHFFLLLIGHPCLKQKFKSCSNKAPNKRRNHFLKLVCLNQVLLVGSEIVLKNAELFGILEAHIYQLYLTNFCTSSVCKDMLG